MRFLANPLVLRMGLLLFAAVTAFGLGLFTIRFLRKNLVADRDSADHSPLSDAGLPVHAYHAVIQQLKQQKHELTSQQLSDRRKAKASETLSTSVLADLPCGVLFLNHHGLVRQANTAARSLLGFASPVGLHASDLFRTATLRPAGPASDLSAHPALGAASSVEQALAPALAGKAAVHGLMVNYFMRDGASLVLEVTASPVVAEDASLMGTTLVLNDKTDIERIRHDQKTHRQVASELAIGLRESLTTIAGHAQQLACSRDTGLASQLADKIAAEAASVDRTIGSFLTGAKAATTSS